MDSFKDKLKSSNGGGNNDYDYRDYSQRNKNAQPESGNSRSLADKLKGTHLHEAKVKASHLKSRLARFKNLINQNHRHDEEHEQETDRKRTEIAESHRFESFAPVREGNLVKYYIDGRDYFWAVSEALDRAKETIYIADWWLTPELFLRRPPYSNQHWRLDHILKRKAEEGVQIYVNVYKEVEAALSCNSRHTKEALRSLCAPGEKGHGNIHVMRHPDHNMLENGGDMTLYWAHHEKFVVIDYEVAFIGGIDLCFGRYDMKQHQLADLAPAGVEHTLFPGQDYNNTRIMDFKSVNDWKWNELSKAEYARMPWHDVAMGVIGPCIYDIAEHFVLRWNFCKRDKYKRDERFDWLTLQGRDEDIIAVQRPKHPVGDYIEHPLAPLENKPLGDNHGTVNAQIVRSSTDWSSGILTEHSIQNAYRELIQKAEHFIYIENQFFITATGENQAPIHNQIGEAIVEAVVRAAKEGRKFKVIVVVPAIPEFAGDLRTDAAAGTRAIMDYQYKSINRGPDSIMGRIKAEGLDPAEHIWFFNLRSYDRINKTPAIKEQEERSGVKYQEVQRANAEEIMSSGIHGVVRRDSDDSVSSGEYDKNGEQEKELYLEKKKRFEAEAKNVGLNTFNDVDGDLVADSVDSIAKNALLDEPKPSEELWNKDHPDQEKENFVQEELYPHVKVMVVDDRYAICGSANINDRSQLGYHDSELAIVIEDTNLIDSTMNGQPFKAGYLPANLRRNLWMEHLGLLHAQNPDASDDPNAKPPGDAPNDVLSGDKNYDFVVDPLNEEVWETWTNQATVNTEVFRHLFHADPDDHITTWELYDDFLPQRKATQKSGHLYDPYMPVEMVRSQLDKIKGHLVWMPLDFLKDEDMAERGMQVNEFTESIFT